MSTTKSTGATKLGRDPQPKYLGIKKFAGEKVMPGMIIIRQRGTCVLAGKNVKRGGDDTLYAMKAGIVNFTTKKITKFDGSQRIAKVVHLEPLKETGKVKERTTKKPKKKTRAQ